MKKIYPRAVQVAIVAVCFLFSFAFYDFVPKGMINDEAVELLQALYLPRDGFYYFAPHYLPYPGFVQVHEIESLVPYVNLLIFHIFGEDLLYIHLFYALCYCVACYVFFCLVRGAFGSETWGWMGALILGGSSYPAFYSRVLTRNGISLLWAVVILWLLWKVVGGASAKIKRALYLLYIPVILVLSILTYTSFKFIAAAVYLSLITRCLAAPRRKDLGYAMSSAAVTLLLIVLLVVLSGTSVRPVIFRGAYVLGKSFEIGGYLRHVGSSFLLPVFFKSGGDFMSDMTHDVFDRQMLSFIIAPFFILGLWECTMRWRVEFGFAPFVLTLWLWGVFILGAGGPSLKHQYALFPLVVFISLCGIQWAYRRASRVVNRAVIAVAVAALLCIFLASEARHLFRTIPADGRLHWETVRPRAVAEEALRCSRSAFKVYIVGCMQIDAMRFYTRREPKVRVIRDQREMDPELKSDLVRGDPVAIVVEGDGLPDFMAAAPPLASCFEKRSRRVSQLSVVTYLSRAECGKALGAKSEVTAGETAPRKRLGMFSAQAVPVSAKGMPPSKTPRVIRAEGKEALILAGGWGGEPGRYNEPRGIALDSKGNVYVADFRNYRIQRFDRLGKFVTAWGEAGERPGQFKDPCGVAVGMDGRVYVADTFNNRVQVFDGNGKYILHFEGGFYAPRGIAVDGSGRIWVTDSGNGVVKLFSSKGEQLKLIGKRGQGKGEFDGPNSVAIDSKGRVYVADSGNRRVQILDGEGNYVSEFKVDGWQQGVFNEPYLDVDERGDIYLTDPPGNRVLKYSQKRKLLGVLKPMEGSEPLLSFPMGIAVEKTGEAVYVVDCQHHRIWKTSKKDFR